MTATEHRETAPDLTSLAGALASAALSLARRFAASGTLWCAAPAWPWHARHVAVEFVHPVIMGKRALPAIAVSAHDPAGSLRLLARPGDALLVVGSHDDAAASDLVRRAPAWGLSTIWCGAGPRPSLGSAGHLVWIDDATADEAASSGQLVMLYHLLWELTHVVFEHPGLLADTPDRDCSDDVCITCSDQAVVAEVCAAGGTNRVTVVAGGHVEHVDASLVSPLKPGDLVLVHAGVAISRIGEHS